MSRDPYSPIVPFVRREQKPDPLREFGAEYPYAGRAVRPQRRLPPAALGLCRFENGREVQRGYDCPHFREPDEDGQDG